MADGRKPDVGPKGKKLTVFVPGTDVLHVRAMIPARSESEARKAAPFAIEDEIGEALDDAIVALGPKPAPGEARQLAVVSADLIQSWTSRLAELGLEDAALASAPSVLPDGNVLAQGPNVLLGRINGRSFTLDTSIGKDVVLGLLNGLDHLAVYGERLAGLVKFPVAGPALDTEEALLAFLAEQADGKAILNLKQGAFARRASIDLSALGQWRSAGILAAVLGLGWFATLQIETWAMNTRVNSLQAAASEYARLGWPESQGNPERALASAGPATAVNTSTGVAPLTLIAKVYEVIDPIEDTQIRSLRYDGGRGQVAVLLASSDFATFDKIAADLSAAGLNVTTGDARQNGALVIAELTVGGAL